MRHILKFFFRSLAAVAALALIAVIVFGLYIFSRHETIPDFTRQPTPTVRVAAPSFAEAVGLSRQEIEEIRKAKYYPSMSISVMRKGVEIWAEATGHIDLRTQKPATPSTLYPSGSIAKSLTATLAMQLVADGVVDLDAPIKTYARDLPAAYDAITLRQLLSHQAGVRHYKAILTPPYFSENGLNKEFFSVRDSLSIFIDDPLLFEPDSSFQYSTFGYTLVSYVLEEATSVPFLELMRNRLFEPVGLDQIIPDHAGRPEQNRTTDYISALQNVGVFRSPQTNVSYKWAGGGFLSTPGALAQFGDMLLRRQILDEVLFDVMTTPRRMANGEINPQKYGLGWRKGEISFTKGGISTPIYHHGGTTVGAECALLLTPEFELSIAVCGNAYTGGSGDLIKLATNIARNFQRDSVDQIEKVEH